MVTAERISLGLTLRFAAIRAKDRKTAQRITSAKEKRQREREERQKSATAVAVPNTKLVGRPPKAKDGNVTKIENGHLKQTGQKIGYIELFEAGIEVLNHPEKARVVVTVTDVVEAGRKALADQLATADTIAEDRGNQSSDRNEKGQFAKPDKTGNIRNGSDYGTSSAYRLGKIKRDHPELAERIAAGEFTLVSQAERAAGLRPPKMSDLEKFQRAYFRLSIVDQAAAKKWLASLE